MNMNLMSLTNKVDILSELKQGNTTVLKGLSPLVAMSYGLALQNEVGVVQDSPINMAAVNKVMLNKIADTKIKESKATGE